MIYCMNMQDFCCRGVGGGGVNNRLKMHAMMANGPTRPTVTEEYLLSSTHEEADTRVFLHVL